jgi:hypothetical protein
MPGEVRLSDPENLVAEPVRSVMKAADVQDTVGAKLNGIDRPVAERGSSSGDQLGDLKLSDTSGLCLRKIERSLLEGGNGSVLGDGDGVDVGADAVDAHVQSAMAAAERSASRNVITRRVKITAPRAGPETRSPGSHRACRSERRSSPAQPRARRSTSWTSSRPAPRPPY